MLGTWGWWPAQNLPDRAGRRRRGGRANQCPQATATRHYLSMRRCQSAIGHWGQPVMALLALNVVACSSSATPAPTRMAVSSSHTPSAVSPNLEPAGNPLPAPTQYRAVCAILASTCSYLDAPVGGLPTALARPLALPAMTPGDVCPTTPGAYGTVAGFGGVALGIGKPVRPSGSFSVSGVVTVLRPSISGGWMGPKTDWYVVPPYDGPVLIRGSRTDASGPVGFGEQPLTSALIIPPGPTVSGAIEGYRTSPGGIWVKSAGCYGVQVDGIDFSYALIFEIRPDH